MAKKNPKLSVAEVSDVVESEDLGYAILEGIKSANIKDGDLADMWERAKELLEEIQEYIEDNADSVDDADEPSADGEDDEDEDY